MIQIIDQMLDDVLRLRPAHPRQNMNCHRLKPHRRNHHQNPAPVSKPSEAHKIIR
ncbi:hypothetical protein LguiB_006728 [Lonicera macranthoides]